MSDETFLEGMRNRKWNGESSKELKTYFFQHAGDCKIKIGRSGDPPRRLKDIERFPGELENLGAFVGDFEGELHRKFTVARHGREWFNPSEDLIQFLRSLGLSPRRPESPPKKRDRGSDHPHELDGAFALQPGDWYDPDEIFLLNEDLAAICTDEPCDKYDPQICDEEGDDEEDEEDCECECEKCVVADCCAVLEDVSAEGGLMGVIWDRRESEVAIVYRRDAFGSRAGEVTESLVNEFWAMDNAGFFLRAITWSPSGGFRDENLFELALTGRRARYISQRSENAVAAPVQ